MTGTIGMKVAAASLVVCLATSYGAVAHAQTPGANTYTAKCVMCHAADGSGNTPAGKATKTPSFNSPEMLHMSDAEFITDTKNGKGKMPAYSGKLSDKDIEAVVAFIRTLQKK